MLYITRAQNKIARTKLTRPGIPDGGGMRGTRESSDGLERRFGSHPGRAGLVVGRMTGVLSVLPPPSSLRPSHGAIRALPATPPHRTKLPQGA